MKRAPNVRSARDGFDRANQDAAQVILMDIARYGGEGSLMVTWARMIEAKQMRRIEGPLLAATGRRAA
jgi:hypothetical protein